MTTTPVTADALVRGRGRRTAPSAPVAAVRELSSAAARAVGCPATAPSAAALGLAWRLRANAHLLAASYAGASADPARCADAQRLRRRGQAWASGARRLEGCSARRAPWLQRYLGQVAALPDVGAVYGAMAAELAVWRLARFVRHGDAQPGGAS